MMHINKHLVEMHRPQGTEADVQPWLMLNAISTLASQVTEAKASHDAACNNTLYLSITEVSGKNARSAANATANIKNFGRTCCPRPFEHLINKV